MKKIPNMISTKDLAYITDMFNWNMIVINKINLYLECMDNESLTERFKETKNLHMDNANKLLSILQEANND